MTNSQGNMVQKPDMETPKAVMGLEISRALVEALGAQLIAIEKRLAHVSLPNNIEEINKKVDPIPSEPNSIFVNRIYGLNKDLREFSARIDAILEALEI